MTIVFLVSALFCVYTYLVFPVWLHLRAKRVRLPDQREGGDENAPSTPSPNALPRVSVLIAAHNEAENLPRKIASLEALDYPEHLLECIFVSDGSTDETVELLCDACERHDLWQLHHYEQAAGKPTALNLGVSQAHGDIIVFMDARQSVASPAIRALVRQLQNAEIGAVSGELVLHDDLGREATNVGLYWKYEKWIRDNESRLFSTTGATGALYAIRRADFQPLPADALLDDFDTPVSLLRKGKRTVLEPAAQVYDQAEADSAREFKRKVRTLTGNFQSFSRHRWLFDPRVNPVWWQFLCHKVFRLLIPYALVLALLACVIGDTPFLRVMLIGQIAFYALGILGFLGLSNRVTSIVKLFMQLNAAAALGGWRALLGRSAVRWKSS